MTLPPIEPCPECSYHMDAITATEWERVGEQFSLHYQCPICGMASPQGLSLEEAQCNWNAQCILLRSV